MNRFPPLAAWLVALLSCSVTAAGSKLPANGVVVSVSRPATDVGEAILQHGGNAVDAAVSTALALAVTWPEAGNIGGGGFMLICPQSGKPTCFDFREVAPAAATKEMFVKPENRSAHRRVGVPGTIAGLAIAHQKYGKLPWKDLVTPAIKLAREGFVLDEACARSLNGVLAEEKDNKEFCRVFSNPKGGAWRSGDRLSQPDLGKTLESISDHGSAGFYSGPVAQLITTEMERGNGLITAKDLETYKAIERQPLLGRYRDSEVVCMPPPSSGGTTLIEALNILENFDFKGADRWSTRTSHLMIEAARRAYRDRACFLGDPAFTEIPTFLTEKAFAKQRAATIDLDKATASKDLAGEIKVSDEGSQTTHFSVVDGAGTAISLTYTLENSYGGRVIVKGAGFILNDEMNDFAWLPGITDSRGRIGTAPNQIAPGKRMLSSMCPTILRRNEKVYFVTGSPGGRTIINTVFNVVVNVIDFHMDPRSAVVAPRFHQQWLPDSVRFEPEIADKNPTLLKSLEQMGHRMEKTSHQGDAHSIWIDPRTGKAKGFPDYRLIGKPASP